MTDDSDTADDTDGEGKDGNKQTNTGTDGGNDNNTDGNGNTGLSQEKYEERIAELDKRDKAMDDKLKRMETLNDKITAEGKATGGAPPAETAEQTQKKTIVKNFGGCIPGLENII